MKLSMWIIAEWMKDYEPLVKVENGKQVLRNVRTLTSNSKKEPQNVYVTPAKDYFGKGEGVICVHERDLILFKTDDIDQIFNEILAAFDYYNDWKDRIREMIDGNCSLQDIIDESECIFKEPIFILDTGFTAIATSKQYGIEKIESNWTHFQNQKSIPLENLQDIMPIITTCGRTRIPYTTDAGIFPYCSVIRTIFSYKRNLGSVCVIAFNKPNTQARVQLINELADAIEYWLRRNEDQNDLKDEISVFLDLIQGNRVMPFQLNHKMDIMGWKNADDKMLIKVKSNVGTAEMTNALLAGIRRIFYDCNVFEYNSCIVMIVNLNQRLLANTLKDLSDYLRSANAYAGLSYIFNDISSLKQHNRQADIALEYGGKESGKINDCKKYALSYAFNIISEENEDDICHPGLAKLLEYDSKHNSQLYDTLRVYLMNERNQSVTSMRFGIHRNSLVYRIHKIEEIIDENLDNMNARVYLMFSYLLKHNGDIKQ